MSREPIAIVGIGCRFPGDANSPSTFWQLLRDGMNAITEVAPERWNREAFYGGPEARPGKMLTQWGGFLKNIDGFDADFFGISPREAAQMDPQQRLVLELAWEALEDAGQVPAQLAGTNTGVFIGVSTADYRILQARDVSSIGPYSDLNSTAFMVANRISYTFDLRGPSLAVDTACASSAEALHLACRSLWRGETSRALVGGVNAMLIPQVSISYSQAGMLSPDGRCQAFNARANGYVRSEGGGLVLLKPLSLALADGDRVYATIQGTAVGHGGASAQGWMAPSEQAQINLLQSAYEDAGVSAADLVYVEAHGIGTAIGDRVETSALGNLLAQHRRTRGDCWLGSVKTNIGHLEAAAGIASVMKVALMLYHRQIPPSLHFEQPNPAILFEQLRLRVPTELMAMPPCERPRIAGVSAFGIGGAGAHIVLQEPPNCPPPTPNQLRAHSVHLLPLSAPDVDALRHRTASFAQFLACDDPPPPLQDIAYTAGVRRAHQRERLAWAVETREELRQELARFAAGGDVEPTLCAGGDEAPALAFLFPGMGPQWSGMGQQLLADEPVFAASLRAFDTLWRQQAGWSLVDEIRAGQDGTRVGLDVQVSAVANVAVQIALAALWDSWGIQPVAITGHSVGELAAACVAGILSLEDTVRLTYGRNQAIALIAGQGKMAAVELSASDILPFLAGYEDVVSIAALNGPKTITLSGTGEAIDAIVHALEAHDVFCRVLRGDTPYHSCLLRRLHQQVAPLFPEVTARLPTTPYVSTVTGELLSTQRLDKAYWVRNVEEPVQFQAAMQALIAQGCRVFIEVGPHPVLSNAVTDCLAERQIAGMVLPSLRRQTDERKTMLASLGRLYREGFTVRWQLVSGTGQHTSLPSYPWQRQRHWNESPASRAFRLGEAPHPLLGRKVSIRDAADCHIWQTTLQPEHMAYLNDHRIQHASVFPGSAYLDMAIAAARTVWDRPDLALENVEFRQALVLEQRHIVLQTSLSSADQSFKIYSRGEDETEWTLHAMGTVAPEGTRERHPRRDAEALRQLRLQCPKEVSGEDDYTAQRDAGYQFGVSFQTLERLWVGDGEAWGVVRVPQGLAGSVGSEAHLILVDSCTQVTGAILRHRPTDKKRPQRLLHLPVGLDRATFKDHLPARFWAHARLLEEGDRHCSFDIQAWDESGNSVVTIQAYHTRAVDADGPERSSTSAPLLYMPRWVEIPLADGAAPAGQRHACWMILADAAGVGQALADRLRHEGQQVVLVPLATGGETDGRAVMPAQSRDNVLPDLIAVRSEEVHEYGRLLRLIPEVDRPLWHIVHLRSLDARAGADAPPVDDIASGIHLQVGLLHLVQALVQVSSDGSTSIPHVWLVTQCAQAVADGDRLTLAQSPTWGLGRVVRNEHPQLGCKLVDLPPGSSTTVVETLWQELQCGGDVAEVAWRAGRRFTLRLQPGETHIPAWQRGDAPVRRRATSPSESFRLTCGEARGLDNLLLRDCDRRPPSANEVELKVVAAGLNYRDVLKVLGLYRTGLDDRDDVALLGDECAGTIVAVGSAVSGWQVGQPAVVSGIRGCFGAYLTLPADFLLPKPAHMSWEEAASLPNVLLTAYHALMHLGRLEKDERVLIHSATGGVGLAAVHLAQRVGAEVFATAGSQRKREYLRALGIAHVSDSRTLDFAQDVLDATCGAGVDLILNSLSGAAVPRGLALLRCGGRFLELGKKDVYDDARIGLCLFKNNISYHAIDLGQLWKERPDLLRKQLRAIWWQVEAGLVPALPVRTFPVSDAVSAFRYMAQAQHVGKVVLQFEPAEGPAALPPATSRRLIYADATYLITGGRGGLGLKFAQWLVQQGARHLVLMGRSAVTHEQQRAIDALGGAGVDIAVAHGDVSCRSDVIQVLADIERRMPPLRGVLHAAGITDDGLVRDLDRERLQRVMAPKVTGAWNLHLETLHRRLDFMVLFSSIAALYGNPGQANYAAANAFLDALAYERRSQGLPAVSINWGPVSDVDMSHVLNVTERLAQRGLLSITSPQASELLGEILAGSPVQVAVQPIDWARFAAFHAAGTGPQLFSALASARQQESPRLPAEPLHVMLRKVDRQQAAALLLSALQRQVATLLGASASVCATDRSLRALGFDSLMSTGFKNWIEREVRITLSTMAIMRGPTLQQLAASIVKTIVADGPSQGHQAGAEAPATAATAGLGRLGQMDRLLGPEEFKFWLFNRRLPFNVVVTARIKGEVDAQALADVLPRVRNRHPLLQVRITDDVRPRFVTDESRPVPLQVGVRHDDQQWVRACEAELGRPFATAMAPLFRVVLLQGKGVADLIVSLPHVMADGLAAIFLARDIIAGLAGGALDPLPELPAFEELIPPAAFSSASRNVLGRWWSRRTTEQFQALSLATLLEHLPVVGPTRIHSGRLSAADTARLAARCQARDLTLHGALAAAGLLALAHAEPTAMTCFHPVSLRDQLSPPLGDDLCLALSHVSTHHTVSRAGHYWDLAHALHHDVMAAMERGEAFDNTLGSLRKLNPKASIVTELTPQLSVSNFGRLSIDPAYGALQIEDIRAYGSNTMHAPSLAAVILQGRLSWDFYYPTTWSRSAEASHITERVRQLLASALA
jgi:acyl transferase domain-containing protein/NADPH:quinone reductase-like Zn-dependent oxidoreductase